MTGNQLTLTALGCSGPVTKIFVDGFLVQDIALRLLARDASGVARRYPEATIVPGSMLVAGDVARALEGADAAFLTTPMGQRNDMSLELAAARATIEAAKSTGLKHLIYVSVIGADRQRGVPVLDAKYDVERLIAASGVPYTILRCGSYMEDVFDLRLPLLKKGKFLFPVTKERRFTYTCQADLAPFVGQQLLAKGRVLNRAFNFVSPGICSIREVDELLSKAAGFSISSINKFPTYYLFMALLPYFYLSGHRFSTILPLIRYFDRHGYTDPGDTARELFPDFPITDLETHLRKIFSR